MSGLIWIASEREKDHVTTKARQCADNDAFLISLLRTRRGEVTDAAGRHVQLRWDRMVDLLGEELLVRRVMELPDELPASCDDDARELLRQAKQYAADPETAKRELEAYAQEYGG